MKKQVNHSHLSVYRRSQPMYPNAADHRYFLDKAVNIVTAIVSGLGFLSAMLFLVTMS